MSSPAAAPASPDDRILLPIGGSPSARRRAAAFFVLEHPVLPRFTGIAGEDGRLAATFRRRDGTPLPVVRHSRETSAALFLQAVSAAVFLGTRGFPLERSDFDDALVEVWEGSPHLWLARPPRSISADAASAEGPASLLAALVPLFFGRSSRGGARIESAPRKLLDRWLDPLAPPGRPDAALVEVYRAFPFLTGEAFASVRRRGIGYEPRGLDAGERRHRAAAEVAARRLAGRAASLFHPGRSALIPYEALRASLGLGGAERGAAEAALRERAAVETDWIRVDPEDWDAGSAALFEEVASRHGIEIAEWSGERASLRPDELRTALWIASPDLASSVALYEALAAVLARRPARVRAAAARFVSSPDYGAFLARGTLPDAIREADADAAARELAALSRDERRAIGIFLAHPAGGTPSGVDAVDGSGAFLPAARRLAASGWLVEDSGDGRWRPSDPSARADLASVYAPEERRAFAELWLPAVRDPLWRCVLAIEGDRAEVFAAESDRLLGRQPAPQRPRALDALIQAAARWGKGAPPAVRYYHADRLVELGLVEEARDVWRTLAAEGDSPWERAAVARLARAAESEGDIEGARRWAALAERPGGSADGISAARRALARLAASEGRFEDAEAILARASNESGCSEEEKLEIALARAALRGLRGDGDGELAEYAEHRRRIAASGERLQFRFLLGEGTALSNRRDHAGAAVRFAEALDAARDPEERGAASIDLAVETYLLGDAAEAERRLREAAGILRRAGCVALARTAAANLVNLLIETGRDADAEPLIDRMRAESERIGDVKGRMLALAFRSRVAFRRGRFAASRADRREALDLCERLRETIEKQELEIDESDARLFAGDPEGALAFARRAAERGDMAGCRERAVARVADLERWAAGVVPEEAELEKAFRSAPEAAAERVLRARAYFGAPFELSHAGVAARARDTLRRAGRQELADAVLPGASAVDPARLRRLRDRIAAGDEPLRVVGDDGEIFWRSASFERAVWRRPLAWGDPPLFLEGGESEPDVTALLFETMRNRADIAVPEAAAQGGIALLRASGIVTGDRSMEAVGARLARIAPQSVTVFIRGESGTGKERVARAVHRLSSRAGGPFVPVNVAAFPEALLEDELFGHARGAFTGADRDRIGLFEAAGGGTLFLDEIGDLSAPLQAKLLRALQEREIRRVGENRHRAVDVRLVSATAKSLETAVERGTFREDLYYRIKVATIELPPLRERGEDVALLARHFVDRYAAEYGKGAVRLAAAALATLRGCRWPGNVRQLENTIMEAVALADPGATLDRDAFPRLRPAAEEPSGSYRERVDAFRRRIVEEALARTGGNRTHAAKEMGVSRQALLYLIRELGVRG
ncbi:MAG TPA: sigma 54-interacting transcriptional regulator [Thermoanaerobaculia bacterium]|nr:sigma 54-interacting transcriptional regulator [Thermoanaerobaculia bacterium]